MYGQPLIDADAVLCFSRLVGIDGSSCLSSFSARDFDNHPWDREVFGPIENPSSLSSPRCDFC